jgi:hypothetical protein
MSNVNQLLMKAMSTTSEEEAMSCLRMARKKGNSFDSVASTSSEYNGHGAKYWYDKAALYYNRAKEDSNRLTAEQERQLWNMYKQADSNVARLAQEKNILERKLRDMELKPSGWWKLPVIVLQTIIIMFLVQMIG